MKAVAAAASMAGILTLAAQSISGVQRLSRFFSNVASASKTAQRFVYDLDLLLQVLQDVKILLDSTPSSRTDLNLVPLQIQLEDCTNDVHGWLGMTNSLRPASNAGLKTWFISSGSRSTRVR